MKRQPLLVLAFALGAGILLAPHLWPWRLWLGLLVAAGGLGLLVWYWWRRELPLIPALFLIVMGGTLLLGPPLPAATAARVTAVRGWLDGEAQVRANRTYAGGRVIAWRLGNGPWAAPGRGLRAWVSGLPAQAGYGQCFEARGKFSATSASGADGYFFAKTGRLLPGRAGNPLRRAALAVRAAMERTYRQYLDPEQRSLLGGLVFGDLPQMSPEMLGWFRDSGVLHLLSVSGLHVGFVLVLVLGLAGLLGWRGWRSLTLAALAVLAYVLLCGAKPPILRAGVMALAAGAGAIGRRETNAGNLLGLAAIAILILQPAALWSISFQLSFAACAGLVYLYPRWSAWCPRGLAPFGKPFLISLAASLAVLPIQAAAFGRVSLIGPVANLLLVPLSGLAVQVGLAAGIVGTIAPWLAGPVLVGLGVVLDLLVALARICAQVPGAALNLGAWPWPVVLGYYLVLGTVGMGMEKNFLNGRPRLAFGWLTLILGAALAGLVWWQVLAVPRGLTVDFIDVGQGDSVFIRGPGGRTALIDGGEDEAAPRVLSYLRKQGVRRLDLVIVSHPHSDHVGGLVAVAEEMPIGQVLDPGWPHPSETYRRFLLVLKSRHIPWRRARKGMVFTLGRDLTGTVFYPYADTPEPDDWNDGSLVIRLAYGRQVLLLPGDLGAAGEEALLAAGGDLRATVLKVAHHASATSTGGALLAAVRPEAAVISVGRGNPFHHPHPETLARLRAARVKVYRTDERGTIRYWTDGRRYRIECAR